MGFGVMVGSLVLGVLLVVFGVKRGKSNNWWYLGVLGGLVFIGVAVWLGWPK